MKKMRLVLCAAIAIAMAFALLYVGCSDNNVVNPSAPAMGNHSPDAVAKALLAKDEFVDQVMKVPGVVGCGVGLDENGALCINVMTAEAVTSDSYAGKIAREVNGYPVKTIETGYFYANAFTKTYRPVPIGVSCGNDNECAAGTIGCVVTKNGVKYILSNNHVLARQNAAKIGEKIDQPGLYDTRCKRSTAIVVGTLSDFQPISFSGSNQYDAAIAAYNTGIGVSCATPAGYYGFPGSTPVNAYVGMPIKKVGRTTSLTTGTVQTIGATVNVGYNGGTAQFTNQIVTSARFDKSGDSGSLVVTNDGSNSPVALLFAGTNTGQAIVSPIAPVLQKFGVTICTQ